MPGSDLQQIMELHLAATARLDARLAELVARETKLRREYDDCRAEKAKAESDRGVLDQAARLYESLMADSALQAAAPKLGTPETSLQSDAQDECPRPPRARVGPKRYAMLTTLRTLGPKSLGEVVNETSISVRRVKDQLSSDVGIGAVAFDGQLYRLTRMGQDLLSRYEASRKSRGLPLPTLQDAIADGTEDDGDADSEGPTLIENEAVADEGDTSEVEAPDQAWPAGASDDDHIPQLGLAAGAAD
jgi:hypothetical protein